VLILAVVGTVVKVSREERRKRRKFKVVNNLAA
jgi:hypothetical protein